MTPLPLSGLGLAAGGGPLGQDTDIVTTRYIGGRGGDCAGDSGSV